MPAGARRSRRPRWPGPRPRPGSGRARSHSIAQRRRRRRGSRTVHGDDGPRAVGDAGARRPPRSSVGRWTRRDVAEDRWRPVARTAAAAATNANAGTMTSSPGPRPTARQARCSAAVPLDTAGRVTAHPAGRRGRPRSAWVRGPMVSQPAPRHASDGRDVVLGHLQRAQRAAQAHARTSRRRRPRGPARSAVMCGNSGSVTSAREAARCAPCGSSAG